MILLGFQRSLLEKPALMIRFALWRDAFFTRQSQFFQIEINPWRYQTKCLPNLSEKSILGFSGVALKVLWFKLTGSWNKRKILEPTGLFAQIYPVINRLTRHLKEAESHSLTVPRINKCQKTLPPNTPSKQFNINSFKAFLV